MEFRQSLSDITRLLHDQRAILAEQSSLLKRTWSIVDLSDADTVVAESSSSRDALSDDFPLDPKTSPGSLSIPPQISQELIVENLIDLDDDEDIPAPGPSTSNGDDGHSPHIDDMRDLDSGYFKGKAKQPDDDTSKMVCEVEKRESTQSIATLPSVVVESEDKILVESTETVRPRPRSGTSSSTSNSRRESEQSVTSLQEMASRDSVASSLPEVITEVDEFFPRVTHIHAHLPPSEKDAETSLESRLSGVLTSHDADIQLRWAEDAFQFIYSDALERKRKMQQQVASPARSPTLSSKMTTEAKKIVEVYIHKGNPKAMFLKARWVETDQQIALQDFLNALARRYLRAAYYIGNVYEQDRKDPRTALGYFKQGSDGGDAACKARLGLAYLRGELGLKKHIEDAIRLILQAATMADSDSADSLFLLAMLQTPNFRQVFKFKEKILPMDVRSARENYFKAAQLGHGSAQLTVGKAYQSKDNELQLPVDPALSLHYLRLASRQGEAEANHCICCWFWFGYTAPDGRIIVAENLELAFRYAHQAARNDYAPAFCDVGYFYEHGKGVKQNYQKATDWYLKAIATGDKLAQKRYDSFINKMGVVGKEKGKEKEERRGSLFQRATSTSTISHRSGT